MIVHVALPIPVERHFSYSVPEKWQPFACLFSRVLVPFHNRTITGFITGIEEEDAANLKEILEVVDIFPFVGGALTRLCEWASRYYVTPMGLVLKYALPSSLQIEKHLAVKTADDTLTGLNDMPLKKAYASLGKDRVFGYFRDGFIELYDILVKKPFCPTVEAIADEGNPVNCLYIGSVSDRLSYYVSLISDSLQRGENVLMLLPDYYLMGDYFQRAFLEEFPGKVLWYGTPTKLKSRMETYLRTRSEGSFLIMGNKGCAFLPAMNLGLIIVERHEEDHYRNEEGFNFNAALLSLKRAELEGIPAHFGTASPSLEVFKYGSDGQFRVIHGNSPRLNTHTEIIVEKGIGFYNPLPDEFVEVIRAGVENKERIAVYTPRKDYSSYLQCIECKTLFICPTCSSVLSYRKHKDSLFCTTCNKEFPYNEQCSKCGSNLIRFSHVGAEFLEERLKGLFPDCPVVKITGETAKKEIGLLRKIPVGSPLIIIGTQTLSGLYDVKVKNLILVGWEELSRISGYRASEKMFHTVMHLLDALNPEVLYFCMERKKRVNPALFLDMEGFFRDELAKRKAVDFPPYTRLFLVEVEKKTEEAGAKIIKKIMEILREEGYEGPITGPLLQKKEEYQWRILLKGNEEPLYRSLLRIYALPDVHIEADPLYL
ncbi:MAG: hypothetical protein C0392_12170 [Syntrophus sp. (in: bacteria)]|nr:hypothetical protein [Syntrophus sp. (in: bacteria)]